MASMMSVLAFLVIFFSLRFFQSNPVSEELSTPVSLESSGSDSSDSSQNDGVHDGCDALVLLDDSNGNENHSIEKRAIPNLTLKGFNFIDKIKEELESACPGVVSCADILVLATRDGIVLAGGPFYPLITGRRDSNQSFFERAMAEIPRPDGNINETLRLFALRGFNDRETVALLGGHTIGKIGCEFIKPRLDNFLGTGQPDPTISSDFLNEMRLNCQDSNSSANDGAPSPMTSRRMSESTMGMSYHQGLSSSISSGSEFDTHYYQIHLPPRELYNLKSPWLFATWGIDIISRITLKATNGHKYILVAIDYFTKWVEAASYVTPNTKKVAQFIQTNIICRYGVPYELVSENGLHFEWEVTEIVEEFGITRHKSSPYRPQTNGAVEAANKTLKTIGRKVTDTNRNWHNKLPFSIWGIGPL
ncbi:hypothetical protein F0562_023990 [Nyssa sinensis]|uniref:Peroxidase n=1 Tax=Nyssa sinensis TaxID=561372 RepID=A0A5J5BJP2_9ASTE|nr:hypothetical protein F0562_023990 [Nyssa sinensis]